MVDSLTQQGAGLGEFNGSHSAGAPACLLGSCLSIVTRIVSSAIANALSSSPPTGLKGRDVFCIHLQR